MTIWAVLLAFLGALNPPRRRTSLSVPERRTVIMGALSAIGVYVVLAVLGATVRDALDVSTPNARTAAGLVLIIVGLHSLVTPIASAPPLDARRSAWLAPVLFPALARPDLALVAFAASGTAGIVVVGACAAIALAKTVLWWTWNGGATPEPTSVERAVNALVSVLLVLAAVRLTLDGVFAL